MPLNQNTFAPTLVLAEQRNIVVMRIYSMLLS